MVHVSLEDDWHILKVRDRARHDTASESPASFRRSTACCVIPDLLTTIILLSRDNTLQADLDTTLSHAQVYYALRKLLRSASPVFHITCDGQVLTDANACWLVKTGSVVKIQPGEAVS